MSSPTREIRENNVVYISQMNEIMVSPTIDFDEIDRVGGY